VVSACASVGGNGVTARPNPFPMPLHGPSSRPAPLPPAASSFSTESFLDAARRLQGVPYRLGGENPMQGFDCSGYVRYVFNLFRIPVPRTVAEQFHVGRKVSDNDIRPGDLLFFTTTAPGASHVAIALGKDEFIHAPGTDGAVRINSLGSTYWKSRLVGTRRIL
jgi:cell wall-associated NlpC family hydrolase